MCFSPEMDLAAGVVITGVGIEALRHTRTRAQVALASLPLLLGAHQLVETFVWWELRDQVCHRAGGIAARTYLFIALFLVPIAVPLAFASLRWGRTRAYDMFFLLAGVISGIGGLVALVDGPVGRRIVGHHITYSVHQHGTTVLFALYVIATCGPGLAARSHPLQAFGIANLAAVVLLVWLARSAVVSLWCVWAAFTSVLISVYLRRAERHQASMASWSTS
ncbi:MAG: DUF6629 family protein [Marmoricola sp.]